MRYFLLSGVTCIVGYIAGVLFGYRSAVVDYVENDAETIQRMADSMYDKRETDTRPEAIRDAMKETDPSGADSDTENGVDGPTGFQ